MLCLLNKTKDTIYGTSGVMTKLIGLVPEASKVLALDQPPSDGGHWGIEWYLCGYVTRGNNVVNIKGEGL